MSRYSRFDNLLWQIPWFRELPDESPLLWLWLNHNPHIAPSGLLRLDVEVASFETLLPESAVRRWILQWARAGWLERDGRYIYLPQYTRQQRPNGEALVAAERDCAALAAETQLAARWLERHGKG